MMKKSLVFMLVLGLTSWAMAVPHFEVIGPIQEHYAPSDMIQIGLVDDGLVTGFMIDCIDDVICPTHEPAGGVAYEPQTFASNFNTTFPGALNYEGQLVAYVSAYSTVVPPVATTGLLYSFMYHVPDVPASTLICIESMGGDWVSEIYYKDESIYGDPILMAGCIHVIPEPATIALLGLGGLLLRRRK